MIVDVHTHFFRPELDFGPRLRADMARCGVNPAAWGDVGERHLETTREADIAVVFGLQARRRTGTFRMTPSLRTSPVRRSGCFSSRRWTRPGRIAWKNSNAVTATWARSASLAEALTRGFGLWRVQLISDADSDSFDQLHYEVENKLLALISSIEAKRGTGYWQDSLPTHP
jgi:hypothetical protein